MVHVTEPQLYVGEERPSLELFKPIENRDFVKPSGGLWTSTYDSRYGSAWVEWCKQERFGFGENGYFPSWIVHPVAVSSLLVIDSYEDLEGAAKYYRRKDRPQIGSMTSLNFEEMAKDFDGMRLTAKGQAETRLTMPESLYGWDCESTVWFRWAFFKVKSIGRQTYPDKREKMT